MTELTQKPESTEIVGLDPKRLMFALSGSAQEITDARKALDAAIDAFAATVALVAVPAGTSGSDTYTNIRGKSHDLTDSAHNAMLRVVRHGNDQRKADVPVRPVSPPAPGSSK